MAAHALYNEIEPFASEWLRALIAGGHVAPGVVETRSITDLQPADVAGPGQRHFFAGIAGWSHALRLAGVRDDADVWTGSCPCQPFSDAGAGGGVDDARHLWPAWFRLIDQCRPPVIFGEQVASKAGLGWLDAVHADLEDAGYAVGAADLCAAGVGAPHRRQRLWFVAYAREGGRPIERTARLHDHREPGNDSAGRSSDVELVDSARQRPQGGAPQDDAQGHGRSRDGSRLRTVGDASRDGDRQHAGELPRHEGEHEVRAAHGDHPSIPAGATRGFWHPAEWLPCTDGVSRPVEPGTEPMAHGVPVRVGKLRAYGNAIVTHVAAEFIAASIDTYNEMIRRTK